MPLSKKSNNLPKDIYGAQRLVYQLDLEDLYAGLIMAARLTAVPGRTVDVKWVNEQAARLADSRYEIKSTKYGVTRDTPKTSNKEV